MLLRTAKSYGPGLPTLRLRLRDDLADDGGKKARSPGEYEGNVRRGKARFLRGCKSLPARVAPAGSNRSRREGNDLSEAFDGKGR
jgi:hypothetical protein